MGPKKEQKQCKVLAINCAAKGLAFAIIVGGDKIVNLLTPHINTPHQIKLISKCKYKS